MLTRPVPHTPVPHTPVPHTLLVPSAPPTLETSFASEATAAPDEARYVRIPLGRIAGARSGDKGGNVNVGLWARSDEAYAWLRSELTVQRFRELLTEAASLGVQRYELPNLRALNFVVEGLLAPGVAATTRPDAQAKGLGEYLRSRTVSVPAGLAAEFM